jgi:hypothetical protein
LQQTEKVQEESVVALREVVVEWEGGKSDEKRVCLEKSLRKQQRKEEGTGAEND